METIRITEEDRLPNASPSDFASAVRRNVGTDLHMYAERKRRWLASVGYEAGAHQLNGQIRLPEDGRTVDQILMDFALGIEPHLDVLGGEVRDVRFGIPAPSPIAVLPQGDRLLVNRKPICPGECIITSRDGRRAVLTGDVYGPMGLGKLLNRDNIKVRFESKFADFAFVLGKSGNVAFTLRLPGGDEPCPIGELGRFCEALSVVADAASPEDAIVEVRFQGASWGTGMLGAQTSLDPEAVSVARVGSHAWSVARRLDLSATTSIRLRELMMQEKELQLAHEMLTENPEVTKIEFSATDPPDPDRDVVVPMAFAIQLGDIICIVAGAIQGAPTAIEGADRYTISRRRWRHHPCRVLRVGEKSPTDRNTVLEQLALTLAGEAHVIRWWEREVRDVDLAGG